MGAVADVRTDMADQIARGFALALAEARLFEGATAPNPAVGCALLDRSGTVLTVAAHYGLPHAEARAIAAARAGGLIGRIDTVVVTLEPCHHSGRTGPCTEAILSTPARSVWYGVSDPNPTAAGGAVRLAGAGLTVRALAELDHPETGKLQADAARLVAPFVTRVTQGRPFVTVKQALNASGNMIPPKGQKTFTGPAALHWAHELRRRADGIVTGSGTILADAPEFTVRHVPDFAGKSRVLCILDRRGRVDAAYRAAAEARGFRVVIAQDIKAALRSLADMGCNEVLIEAGPSVLGSIEALGCWDEWVTIAQPNDQISIRVRE
jgi:diaminohydroxyphosphoribosylaminopyrimidine deaminase/5-amino-6-(5-phosphoribosylamino)uracil reductase